MVVDAGIRHPVPRVGQARGVGTNLENAIDPHEGTHVQDPHRRVLRVAVYGPRGIKIAVDQVCATARLVEEAAAASERTQGHIAAKGIGFQFGQGRVLAFAVHLDADVLQRAVGRVEYLGIGRILEQNPGADVGQGREIVFDRGLVVKAGGAPEDFVVEEVGLKGTPLPVRAHDAKLPERPATCGVWKYQADAGDRDGAAQVELDPPIVQVRGRVGFPIGRRVPVGDVIGPELGTGRG